MITIKVPATTANLGSGFDVFGLALSLYDQYTFEKSEKFSLHGFNEKYNNERNLVLVTYKRIFDLLQKPIIPVSISSISGIPNCGGLGSSAACIVAAIIGANYFLNNPLSTQDILDMATMFEGHPDNVTPCILGGLVASCQIDNRALSYKYLVNSNLKFTILAPSFNTNTKEMRSLLPKEIKLADALFNMSRSSMLATAMEKGNLDDLFYLCQDKLHQQYRISHIEGGEYIMDWCYERKIPCVISGSGASILIITHDYSIINGLDISWQKYKVEVDYKGAEIL